MKKKSIIAAFFLATAAYATETNQVNSITTNPAIFLGVATVSYEKSLSPNNSFLGSVQYYSNDISGSSVTALGVEAGYRRYFSSVKKFSGTYGTFKGGLLSASANNGSASASTIATELAGLIGYKWITDGGFTSELGIGVATISGQLNAADGYNSINVDMSGTGVTLDLNFGYSF